MLPEDARMAVCGLGNALSIVFTHGSLFNGVIVLISEVPCCVIAGLNSTYHCLFLVLFVLVWYDYFSFCHVFAIITLVIMPGSIGHLGTFSTLINDSKM